KLKANTKLAGWRQCLSPFGNGRGTNARTPGNHQSNYCSHQPVSCAHHVLVDLVLLSLDLLSLRKSMTIEKLPRRSRESGNLWRSRFPQRHWVPAFAGTTTSFLSL